MVATAEIQDRISKCQKILQADPNSQIFAALAEAYRKKGDLDSAFRICQNGLKIHPSYGSAHVVMAKINMDRGLYDWAEAEIKKAEEIDGRSRAIDLLLAEINLYNGNYKQSVRLLTKLHEIDPANQQIRRLLEIAERAPQQQPKPTPEPATVRTAVTEETEVAIATPKKSSSAGDRQAKLSAEQILRAALEVGEISGGLLVNSEGLILESLWRHSLNETDCAARMAEVDIFLCQELVKASFGICHTILIETDGPVFYLHRTDSGTFLFVTDASINLGTLRMKLSNLLSRYVAE